jgi:hypothetical protein
MLGSGWRAGLVAAIGIILLGCGGGGGTDSCGDVSGSLENCGACGRVCSGENSASQCVAGQCVLECVAGWGDCDQNAGTGCETPLDSDAASCGACGHDCEGSACTAGRCEPRLVATSQQPLVMLAATNTQVLALANGGGNTYQVSRVPRNGGALTTAATISLLLRDFQADAFSGFVAGRDTNFGGTGAALLAIAEDGGTRTLAPERDYRVNSARSLGDTVYFAGQKIYNETTVYTDVYAVPAAGGTVTGLGETPSWPQMGWVEEMTATATELVWVDCDYDGIGPCRIWVTTPSGPPVKVLSSGSTVGPLAASDTHIYYWQIDTQPQPVHLTLYALDRAGGGSRPLTSITPQVGYTFERLSLPAFAADATGVFVAVGNDIRFFPADGGPEQTEHTATAPVRGLALRGASLFWVEGNGPATIWQRVR